MPSRLSSLLLAFALVAIVLACAGSMPGISHAAAAPVAAVDESAPRHSRKPLAPRPTIGERAARIALQAVGVPYRWGGASMASGFDCSGLVYWAYRRLGIELPHSSYALYGEGRRVAPSRMKAGDLVFFSGLGHVGLYLGHGRMVHAPHSGALVQIVNLGDSHYGQRVVGARRIAHA